MSSDLIEKYCDYVKCLSTFKKKKLEHVRISTYNVNLWKNYLSKSNFDALLNTIIDINADIMCLNEALFSGDLKNKFINKMHTAGYQFIKMCNDKYGINIIMSKYEIISSKIILLKKDKTTKYGIQRYALLCDVKINNIIIKILSTHLDVFDNTEQTRLSQIMQIIDHIDDDTIIVGDLNSLHKNDYTDDGWLAICNVDKERNVETRTFVTEYLTKNDFKDVFHLKQTKLNSLTTVWSMRRVDYMLIRPTFFLHKIKKCQVYPSIASDHLSLSIDIKIAV